MIEFSQNILDTSNLLIERAKELPSVQFEWQTPIVINTISLNTFQHGIEEVNIQNLILRKDIPAIYYFKLINCADPKVVVEKLRKFKDAKTHSCPKIDNRGFESEYLYCGSVRKNLHGRLIQHLGKGHKLTYSLQLAYWACDLDLCIEYHYAWLDKKHVGFTELLESALARRISPLVGRAAK